MQSVSQRSSTNTRCLSNSSGDDDDVTAAAGRGKDQPHLAAPAEPSKVPASVNESGEGHADPADFDQDEFVMFSGEGLTSDRRMDDGFVDLPIMQGAGVMAPPKPELVAKYLSPVPSYLPMHIASTPCIRSPPAPFHCESIVDPLQDHGTRAALAMHQSPGTHIPCNQ